MFHQSHNFQNNVILLYQNKQETNVYHHKGEQEREIFSFAPQPEFPLVNI